MNNTTLNTISIQYQETEDLGWCDNCNGPYYIDYGVYTGSAIECAECGAASLSELAGRPVEFVQTYNGVKARVGNRDSRMVIGGMPGYNEVVEIVDELNG